MIRTLHSLRFVFIMLVVISHIPPYRFDFGGEVGVAFFFILSGFVLAYAYGERIRDGQFHHVQFLKKQFSKIYPLYLLTLVVMLLMNARLGITYGWPVHVSHVLLLQSWIPDEDFYFANNGPAWFLSGLFFFYLIFPWLYKWLTETAFRRLMLVGVLLLALYVFAVLSLAEYQEMFYVFPLFRLPDFCLGILLARCYRTSQTSWLPERLRAMSAAMMTAWELLFVAWIVGAFFVFSHMPPVWRYASFFWIVLPPFIFAFILADKYRGLITALLHHPVLQSLGTITLEVYLLHSMVLRFMNHLLGADEETMTKPLHVILLLVGIVVVAYFMKYCFVNPVYLRLCNEKK